MPLVLFLENLEEGKLVQPYQTIDDVYARVMSDELRAKAQQELEAEHKSAAYNEAYSRVMRQQRYKYLGWASLLFLGAFGLIIALISLWRQYGYSDLSQYGTLGQYATTSLRGQIIGQVWTSFFGGLAAGISFFLHLTRSRASRASNKRDASTLAQSSMKIEPVTEEEIRLRVKKLQGNAVVDMRDPEVITKIIDGLQVGPLKMGEEIEQLIAAQIKKVDNGTSQCEKLIEELGKKEAPTPEDGLLIDAQLDEAKLLANDLVASKNEFVRKRKEASDRISSIRNRVESLKASLGTTVSLRTIQEVSGIRQEASTHLDLVGEMVMKLAEQTDATMEGLRVIDRDVRGFVRACKEINASPILSGVRVDPEIQQVTA